MQAIDAIQQRHSTRAFLSKPVSQENIFKLLNIAKYAPSGSNTQPWQVSVLMGDHKAQLCAALLSAQQAGTPPHYDYTYLPATALPSLYLQRKKACGLGLYQTLGIARENKALQIQHWQANYRAFDAPVMLLFWMDSALGQGSLLDIGGFIQTLAIAAQAEGYATCIQASLAQYPEIARQVLTQPENKQLICGMALGYADPNAPVNHYRPTRVEAGDFTTFYA